MDAGVRESCGLPMERNGRWKGRTGRKCSGCGKTLYRRKKGERCAGCRNRSGVANPFFRKTHTGAARNRMREAAGQRDPGSYRPGKPNPALLSARRREEWARRTPEEKEKHLASFIAAGQVHNRKSSKTQIETAVRRMLDEAGIRYRQNVQIGRFNVDFLCGDVIVECLATSGTAIRGCGHRMITTDRCG